MALKVIKDFQQGDSVVIRLEFDGPINLTGNSFSLKLASNIDATPIYSQTFVANTNAHVDDDLVNGIINLVVATSSITEGVYMYSLTRTDTTGYVTTIARTGLNGVLSVECKKQL